MLLPTGTGIGPLQRTLPDMLAKNPKGAAAVKKQRALGPETPQQPTINGSSVTGDQRAAIERKRLQALARRAHALKRISFLEMLPTKELGSILNLDLVSLGRLALVCRTGSLLAEGVLCDSWEEHTEQWSRARLDEMVEEAVKWISWDDRPASYLEGVAKSCRQLLRGLVLTKCQTGRERQVSSALTQDSAQAGQRVLGHAEDLKLTFSLPCKESYVWTDTNGVKHGESVKSFKWDVSWMNLLEQEEIVGCFACEPMFEDPPGENWIHKQFQKWKGLSKKEVQNKLDLVQQRFEEEHKTLRPGWELHKWPAFRKAAESWRRAAGVHVKALSWVDCARAVCAGVWVLAKNHPKNMGEWVLPLVAWSLKLKLDVLANKAATPVSLNPCAAASHIKKERQRLRQTCPDHSLSIGSRVKVVHDVCAVFNGRMGTVRAYQPSNDRYIVKLDRGYELPFSRYALGPAPIKATVGDKQFRAHRRPREIPMSWHESPFCHISKEIYLDHLRVDGERNTS